MNKNILKIYCDESGFTGNNLLHDEQTVFTYAAVACGEDDAKSFVQKIVSDYKIQSLELKGTNLITQKSGKGKKAILEILEYFDGQYKVSVHHKKFALACKFFEYIFEPVLAKNSILFYKNGFHLFISNYLFMMFNANTKSAQEIFKIFEDTIRTKQFSKLQKLFSELSHREDEAGTHMILEFIKFNYKLIREEFESSHKWTLDLSTSSLYTLLAEWNRDNEYSMQVFCDNSKPIEYDKDFFNSFIGREDKIMHAFIEDAPPLTFNLYEAINMVDSKTKYGVQIADIVSVAYAYAFKNDDEFSKKVIKYSDKSIIHGNIVPDRSFVDSNKSSTRLNMMILRELYERSINKRPLLDNFTEDIREFNIQLVLNKLSFRS
ncbi:MAG: hypothetical protein DRG78_01230 [Epsilonproteobacteria bacterium]|nr:MAG: hypothetical protein DRG78_01230 [Campylobacterota bacterium]